MKCRQWDRSLRIVSETEFYRRVDEPATRKASEERLAKPEKLKSEAERQSRSGSTRSHTLHFTAHTAGYHVPDHFEIADE
jgi:hypothetical protein